MIDMQNKYNPKNDNVLSNSSYQGVPSDIELDAQHETKYSGIDSLQNAIIEDERIYITTHDSQHELVKNGEFLPEVGPNRLSGYFTSEATAMKRIEENGTFDAYGLARDTCIMPFSQNKKAEDATDKAHLDAFTIDRNRLEEIYGTRDFNAAIGKCHANNQFGSDGGDQGYNANLNELYNNGCLKYSGTYDASFGSTTKCQNDYKNMIKNAAEKTNLYIEQRDNPVSGKNYDELIKNQGFSIDPKSYEDTNFKVSRTFNNSDELNSHYKDYEPSNNSSIKTSPSDRISQNKSMDNQLKLKPQEEINLPLNNEVLSSKQDDELSISENKSELSPVSLVSHDDNVKVKSKSDLMDDSESKISNKKDWLSAA